jgi:predicted transcriptional regulator
VLLKYLRINPKTLHVMYFDNELPNRTKILLYFLARRAMKLAGRIESEGARAVEISEATGLNGNSVRPLLHHLEDAHLVSHTDNLFRVSLSQLSKVIAAIEAKS